MHLMKILQKLFKPKSVEATTPEETALALAKAKKRKLMLWGIGLALSCVILDAILAKICLPCGGLFIKALPDMLEALSQILG